MQIPPVRSNKQLFRAFLFVALALSITRLVEADPYQHRESGFECPDHLASFARIGVDDYESKHPGLGIACKYRLQNDLFADIYIYTAGMSTVPADVTDPLISRLRGQTLREIEEFSQSRGEQVRKMNETILEVRTDRGPVPVLYDSFVISAPNGTRNTWLWLWTARNHVMKIRMTRPPSGDPDPKLVREFYETVVRMAAS